MRFQISLLNRLILEIKSSENLPQKVGADAKKWVASFIDKQRICRTI